MPARVRRYRQILLVLARHGFGVLAASVLPRRFPVVGPRAHRQATASPGHLRAALEELGTTFIKIGQILSTRADVLPAAYARELERLQDHVPAAPLAAIRGVVEAELGAPLAQVFSHFDPTPIASASIGQVHRARLADGRPVVVKVQKPGVAEQVEVDLAILRGLAQTAAARGFPGPFLDLPALVDEFTWTLRGELDYEREARNAAAMARNFAGHPVLHVPQVLTEWTTHRLLVMEEVRGIRIDDKVGLRAAGIDVRTLAHRSAHILLRSVFEDGLYHADPHPGNFLVGRDGSLTALDFGMVGRLDTATRDALLRLVLSVVQREPAAVLEALEALGVRSASGERRPVIREVAHLLDAFADAPLGDIALAPLITEMFSLVRRFQLQLPADLALLLKTLAMNEGVGRQLDPSFVATEEAATYLRDLAFRRLTSRRWMERSARDLGAAAASALHLPSRIERALDAFEGQAARRQADWRDLERTLAGGSRRVALAILAAGAAVCGTLLLVVSAGAAGRGWLEGTGLVALGGAVTFAAVSLGRRG